MRRWGLVALWVLALTLTTAVTWQIVNAAGQSVGTDPGAPINVGAPTVPESPSTTTVTTTTTSTTAPSGSVTSPTSSAPLPTSPPETVVIPSAGGTLTVGVANGAVTYLSAVPAPGYALEIDDAGPPRVRVEFESDESKVEIRAEWANGALVVDVDTDD